MMRRLMLFAGALSCIAVSDASGQSSSGRRAYCTVGSTDCSESYFEVGRKTESVFELLFLDLFSSDRVPGKRALRAPEIPTFPNEGRLADVRPDDGIALNRVERQPANNDSPRTERARNSWDWSEIAPQLREWGWPGFEFERGRRANAGEPLREAKSDDVNSDRDGPRRNQSPSDDRAGESPRTNAETPSSGLPSRPDIAPQPNAEITPEPSTLVLVSTGIPLAFAFFRARRRRSGGEHIV